MNVGDSGERLFLLRVVEENSHLRRDRVDHAVGKAEEGLDLLPRLFGGRFGGLRGGRLCLVVFIRDFERVLPQLVEDGTETHRDAVLFVGKVQDRAENKDNGSDGRSKLDKVPRTYEVKFNREKT